MKKIMLAFFMLFLIGGCNEPETLVINIVGRDGSIVRKIVFKTEKDSLDYSAIRAPADSTWIIEREVEILRKQGEEPDTLYIFRLKKEFAGVEEINSLYLTGKDKNNNLSRRGEFETVFRLFNTKVIFKEVIDPVIEGLDPKGFFSEEELDYFYMPEELRELKASSADSTHYKELDERVTAKEYKWTTQSLVFQWIQIVDSLSTESGKESPGDFLKANLELLADSLDNSDMDENEIIRSLLGEEFAREYSEEIKSGLELTEILLEKILLSGSYTVGIEMPGKLTGTNGYMVEGEGLRWFVKDAYYLTTPYVISAESVVPNWWTWLVTGSFMIFVLTGIMLRRKKPKVK